MEPQNLALRSYLKRQHNKMLPMQAALEQSHYDTYMNLAICSDQRKKTLCHLLGNYRKDTNKNYIALLIDLGLNYQKRYESLTKVEMTF